MECCEDLPEIIIRQALEETIGKEKITNSRVDRIYINHAIPALKKQSYWTEGAVYEDYQLFQNTGVVTNKLKEGIKIYWDTVFSTYPENAEIPLKISLMTELKLTILLDLELKKIAQNKEIFI